MWGKKQDFFKSAYSVCLLSQQHHIGLGDKEEVSLWNLELHPRCKTADTLRTI
jgi:hypothetical protein